MEMRVNNSEAERGHRSQALPTQRARATTEAVAGGRSANAGMDMRHAHTDFRSMVVGALAGAGSSEGNVERTR